MKKILTIYYSRKGQNYFNGTIRDLEKGNTERVAEFIQEAVGGDIFEVETVKAYPFDYTACTKEAQEEKKKNVRVAVKYFMDDLEKYDTIFVGYPNWWGTMPMVMFTFLEHYDLTGKTIIPFCTNEGSGMGTSERDLKTICKGADLKRGLAIHGSESARSENTVKAWAKKQTDCLCENN